MSSRRITIFDTTLRDGEQAPGIALRPDDKVEVGEQLERLGVDVIEAGFAASSPGDFEGVRAVARAAQRATVASLCRASPTDIDAAAAALEDAPRSRIHVFLATSALHMEKKLRLRPDEVVAAAGVLGPARMRRPSTRSSSRARTRPAPIRRSSPPSAEPPSRPARRRSTCRTPSATCCPAEYAAFFRDVRGQCPELEDVVLSAHCHDDLGLAVANSLAALDAGVEQLECTVNGIGERAGNASLEEVVMALRVRGGRARARTPTSTSRRSARRRDSSSG